MILFSVQHTFDYIDCPSVPIAHLSLYLLLLAQLAELAEQAESTFTVVRARVVASTMVRASFQRSSSCHTSAPPSAHTPHTITTTHYVICVYNTYTTHYYYNTFTTHYVYCISYTIHTPHTTFILPNNYTTHPYNTQCQYTKLEASAQ